MSDYAVYVAKWEEFLLGLDANKNTYISRAEFEKFNIPTDPTSAILLEDYVRELEEVIESKTGQPIIYSDAAYGSDDIKNKELVKKFFETLDANGDGYISFQEIRDAKMDK